MKKRQEKIPNDPFLRLLWRLDHAPIDLPSLVAKSEQGEIIRQVAQSYADVLAPLNPILKSAAQSKALSLAERIPLVGGYASGLQLTLKTVSEASQGFTTLLNLDKAYTQPLRRAITTGEKLRRERQPIQLEQARRDFSEAALALNKSILGLEKQQERLLTIETGLVKLKKLRPAKSQPAAQPGTIDKICLRLQGINSSLTTRGDVLKMLFNYVQICSDDTQEALGQKLGQQGKRP